jgi:hypothetical protein
MTRLKVLPITFAMFAVVNVQSQHYGCMLKGIVIDAKSSELLGITVTIGQV